MADNWIIYAVLGVLVLLLLCRVAAQRKDENDEAKDLRATVLMTLSVFAAVMVVWYFIK